MFISLYRASKNRILYFWEYSKFCERKRKEIKNLYAEISTQGKRTGLEIVAVFIKKKEAIEIKKYHKTCSILQKIKYLLIIQWIFEELIRPFKRKLTSFSNYLDNILNFISREQLKNNLNSLKLLYETISFILKLILKRLPKNRELSVTYNDLDENSCYNLEENCIYLDKYKYENSNIISVAIAAHECGHAWFYTNYRYLSNILNIVSGLSKYKISNALTFIVPLILILKNPQVNLFLLFSYSLVLGALLIFITNYCKEIEEVIASEFAKDFLKYENLISESEEKGIDSILYHSLLSYKKQSFITWIYYFFTVLLLSIILFIHDKIHF